MDGSAGRDIARFLAVEAFLLAQADRPRDRLCLTALFSTDTRIGAGSVDKCDHRQVKSVS